MTRMTSLMLCLGVSALVLGPLAPVVPILGADMAIAKNDGNGGGNGNGNSGGKSSNAGGNAKSGGTKSAKTQAPRKSVTQDATLETAAIDTVPAKNAHGLLASELKGLNAVHANPNALAHAAPNSQVGRIAAYRDAAIATGAASDTVNAAQAAYDTAAAELTSAETDLQALNDSYAGRSTVDIDADVAALDPTATDYQEKLDALNLEREAAASYETGKAALETAVADATTAASDALTTLEGAQTALGDAETVESDALLTASNGRELSPEAVDYIRTELGL